MLFYSPENYLLCMLSYLFHKIAKDFFDITDSLQWHPLIWRCQLSWLNKLCLWWRLSSEETTQKTHKLFLWDYQPWHPTSLTQLKYFAVVLAVSIFYSCFDHCHFELLSSLRRELLVAADTFLLFLTILYSVISLGLYHSICLLLKKY